MKRRDFFGKTGCGAIGLMMAYFGLSSCKKEEEAETPKAATQEMEQAAEQEAPMEEMSRKDMVKKMLIESKGVTEEEADAMIADFEEKLSMVKEQCICKNCPSYVAEETELGFCHALVGKSKVITAEKGCICGQCPVYKDMGLKNGYYCTRKSELEQEMAKTA
jgi:hypothetical protein